MDSNIFSRGIILTCIFLCTLTAGSYANKTPRFKLPILVVQTDEEQPVGTLLAIVTARDPDGDRVIYYVGKDAENRFSVNSESGEIVLAKRLDRERLRADSLEFTVQASDDIEPLKRSSIKVLVHIRDINDNRPKFIGTPYNVSISEALEIDSFVYQVKASDEDQKQSLLYYIVGGNEANAFSIAPYAGVVRTKKKLDYEKTQKYTLNISVEDGHPDDRSRHVEYTPLTINIQDYDDNGPVFLKANYSAHIGEGSLKGTFVAKISAVDKDKGINAPVTYSLSRASNRQGLFKIDSRTGIIRAYGEFQRTVKPIYVLEVLGYSKNHPPAKARVTVYVNGAIKRGPVFDRGRYFGEVRENCRMGKIVLTVTATDPDQEPGIGNVHYEIWMEGKTFGINGRGQIYVNDTIDREIKDTYTFHVIAREPRSPATLAEVVIRVLDENDNPPRFMKQSYIATVYENSPPNVKIMKIFAKDSDLGANGEVSYSLVPDSEGTTEKFFIDPESGWLWTRRSLDREERSQYTLLVRASDRAQIGERRHSTVRVQVQVVDQNDHSPRFKSTALKAGIFQDAWINTEVTRLEATDEDDGNFSRPIYIIVSGNEMSLFQLDPLSGSLTVASSLVKYATWRFTLVVTAWDNYGRKPSRNVVENATVEIKVYEANSYVLIITRLDKDTLVRRKQEFKQYLEKLLNMGIVIHKIKDNGDGGSEVVFHGFNQSDSSVIARSYILSLLTDFDGPEKEVFVATWDVVRWTIPKPVTQLSSSSKSKENSGAWHPAIYAVLFLSVLIALGGVSGLVYAYRAKRRFNGGNASSSDADSVLHFRNNSYWFSQEEVETTNHGELQRLHPVTDLVELYGPKGTRDSSTPNNNARDDTLPLFDKHLQRTDSRASSLPFANSSCSTICRAPSMTSSTFDPSTLQLQRKSSSFAKCTALPQGKICSKSNASKSEPQLTIKRLSIVLDTNLGDHEEYRGPYAAAARRYRLGVAQQSTC